MANRDDLKKAAKLYDELSELEASAASFRCLNDNDRVKITGGDYAFGVARVSASPALMGIVQAAISRRVQEVKGRLAEMGYEIEAQHDQ